MNHINIKLESHRSLEISETLENYTHYTRLHSAAQHTKKYKYFDPTALELWREREARLCECPQWKYLETIVSASPRGLTFGVYYT